MRGDLNTIRTHFGSNLEFEGAKLLKWQSLSSNRIPGVSRGSVRSLFREQEPGFTGIAGIAV